MTLYKQVDGEIVPMSQEEEAALVEQDASWRKARCARLVQDVPIVAGEVITAILPLWRQSNLHTKYLMLLRKGATLTAEEQEEIQKIEASWAWIDAVRAAADTLAKQIEALSDDQIDHFVWPAWPAPPASV